MIRGLAAPLMTGPPASCTWSGRRTRWPPAGRCHRHPHLVCVGGRPGGVHGTSATGTPHRRHRSLPGGRDPGPTRPRPHWRVTVVDDGGTVEEMPAAATVLTSLADFDAAATDASAVIVATQGHYDEPALEAALRGPSPYVGLVASKKRAESVLGYIRDRGHPDEQVARVRTPVGLDLGHVEHREIAVAILAELVRLKSSGGLGGVSDSEAAPPACHRRRPRVRDDRRCTRSPVHHRARRRHGLLLLPRMQGGVRPGGAPRGVGLSPPVTRRRHGRRDEGHEHLMPCRRIWHGVRHVGR